MPKVNLNQLKKTVTNVKNYTDSKTKSITEKYDAYILNNAVPESSVIGKDYDDENITLYKISDSDIVFPENSILTDEDLKNKLSSINKLSETQKCIITYNDGTQDITKNIELEYGSYYSTNEADDGLRISLEEKYKAENGEIKSGLFVIVGIVDKSSLPQSDERLMSVKYKYLEVKKITLYIELYKNQLPDKAIIDLNFDKITNLPTNIEKLKNNEADVLTREEKILLIKNRSLWGSENIDDYNKAPYTTSATNNTFRNTSNINSGITVKAKKPALGKGLKIEPFYYVYTYYLYYRKSPNVVIDIINSKGTIIHSLDSNEDADTLQFYNLSANTFDKNNDCYFVFSLKEDAPTNSPYGVYQFHLVNMGDSILTYVDIDKKLDKKEISKYASISYVDGKVAGLATKTYVDDKTSMENVIFDGQSNDPLIIHDYWTHCPVSDGNGCWVVDKQITFDSSKPNPYYLLCDNTLYSPENSTFDATNSAWIYPKVPNTGTIFICNKYNNENKLILPWDDTNSPLRMKLYTKTELATAISDGDLEATSAEVKDMLAKVLGGDYSGEKN
nr:MAG TPA: hypothetical protein [Caudoviricetes sp.]